MLIKFPAILTPLLLLFFCSVCFNSPNIHLALGQLTVQWRLDSRPQHSAGISQQLSLHPAIPPLFIEVIKRFLTPQHTLSFPLPAFCSSCDDVLGRLVIYSSLHGKSASAHEHMLFYTNKGDLPHKPLHICNSHAGHIHWLFLRLRMNNA